MVRYVSRPHATALVTAQAPTPLAATTPAAA
jgi:hypothetical protein